MTKENKGTNKRMKYNEEYGIYIGEWIYQRGNAAMAKHHWYVCPNCGKIVDQKENFCPTCSLPFDLNAYKKYVLGEE